jgi:membrane protein DedA with SNARE-associated domain
MSFVTHVIETYGLFVVAVLVCFESVCLPVPGETVLILAAIFAGTEQHPHIVAIIACAAAAAIVGQIGGYLIGRTFGFQLLLRYGRFLRITEKRIKLGEYLFLRYGVSIVVVSRFIPLLRSMAGILAGANRMPWPAFLFANILGALAWTSAIGYLSFLFGSFVQQTGHWVGLVVAGAAATAIIVGINYLRRHEQRLTAEAELALPGTLVSG